MTPREWFSGGLVFVRHNFEVKKLKIVVVSDLHPDVQTLGVSRFDEVHRSLKKAVAYAIKIGADVFLFLGDLCDPDSGGETFRAIAMLIEAALELASHGIQVILIAGNHDVNEDGTGATTLSPIAAIEKLRGGNELIYVAEQPRFIHIREDVGVLCLPFVASSHGMDLAEETKRLWPENTRVIVASHLSVPGIIPGEETTEMPRGREIGYPFEETKNAIVRLQGHYHRRQTFDPGDGGEPIIVPGSLARLTFGEEDHSPAFLLVEV